MTMKVVSIVIGPAGIGIQFYYCCNSFIVILTLEFNKAKHENYSFNYLKRMAQT